MSGLAAREPRRSDALDGRGGMRVVSWNLWWRYGRCRGRCEAIVAGLVTPRSGLAIDHGVGLLNAPGLIDPNYRGEIKVIVHNTSERRYTVEIGDRIAQLLLVPYWAPELEVVDALPASERGSNGFGSSGR